MIEEKNAQFLNSNYQLQINKTIYNLFAKSDLRSMKYLTQLEIRSKSKSHGFVAAASKGLYFLILTLLLGVTQVRGLDGTLTTDPTEINTDATLTVLVSARDSVKSGDQIELVDIFPGSFDTSTTECSLSNEFTGWLSITACDVQETSVIVTLEPIFSVALFELKFTHFTNPPSSSTTSVTVKRYQNGNLYEEAESMLSEFTPTSLTAQSMTALSDQIGAQNVEIQFTVTLYSPLPASGKVGLTVPYWNPDASSSQTEDVFTTQPVCTQTTSQTSATCSFDAENQLLLISNLGAADAGETLTFTANRFRNPYNALQTTGYVAYTTDSEGNLINQSSSEMGIQVSTPSTLTSVSLTNSAKQVGELSIFSLRFTVGLPADASCRLKIYVPAYFSTDTIAQVRGFTMFTNSQFQTISDSDNEFTGYIMKDGCDGYIHTSSTSESIFITSLVNMGSARDSDSFKIEFYAVQFGQEYLVASNVNNAYVEGSTLDSGIITDITATSRSDAYVGTIVQVIFGFTPITTLPGANVVEFQLPNNVENFGLDDTDSCTLGIPLTNAGNPTSCIIYNNKVTIVDINGGSEVAANQAIEFTLSDLKNSYSVEDVGAFTVKTYEVYQGSNYLIDTGTQDGIYSAIPNAITIASVTASSYITFDFPVTYTLTFIPASYVPAGALLKITIPVADIAIESVAQAEQDTTVRLGSGSAFVASNTIDVDTGVSIITNAFLYRRELGDWDPDTESDPTIYVTIGFLKNPGSKQLTNSFSIVIETPEGNAIDSITQGIALSMTSIGQLSSVTVEPASKINGAVTSYIFQVITNEQVTSGDKFKFDIPSEIVVPASVSCSATVNLVSVSCSRSTNTITATLTVNGGQTASGTTFEFALLNVENPPSTAPTSPFTNIFMTDSEGFEKAKYDIATVTAKTEVGGQISTATLAQSSYDNGGDATYTLTVQTVNKIPSGAAFMISYSDDVSFPSNAQTCQVATTGSIYTMTCVVERSVRRITMRGNFSTEVPAGNNIDILIGEFKNPLTEGTQSFSVSIFSDQATQYIIDEASQGMIPGIECVLPCKSCVGINAKSTCTSCHSAGTYVNDAPYLIDNTCIETCPDGYYADLNNKCQECYYECETCADFYTCLTCSPRNDWPYFYENGCYDECPSQSYVDQDNVCQTCETPCLECTGPENGECNSCIQKFGNQSVFLDGTTCLRSCPVGKLSQNYECKSCTSGCTTCEVTQDQCTSCIRNTYLLGTQCYAYCPVGYITNKNEMICEGCDPRCKSCEGAGNYEPVCTECNEEFYLYQGFCFTDCPDGWEIDVTTNSTCSRIVYDLPESYGPILVSTVNMTESLLCSSKGSNIQSDDAFKFPFTILLVVMILITVISYWMNSKTRLTATLITFIAPVEVLAIIAQCYLAYQTEGFTGLTCIDDNGRENRVLPIIFWITLFVIVLIYILNFWFTFEVCCNKKLKKDVKFGIYRSKYKKVYAVFHLSCLLVSFKMCAMLYSFFLGRKRYKAQFTRQRNFFKITNCINLTFLVFGTTPLFFCNLTGLAFYTKGTQFYISMIDTTVLILVMVILQVIDFKHVKTAIENEKKLKNGEFVESDSGIEDEPKRKRKQKWGQLDSSQRALLKVGGGLPDSQSMMNIDPVTGRRSLRQRNYDASGNMLNSDQSIVGNGKIDPDQPDGLRSGNEVMVSLRKPPSSENKNFNENDILGDLDRDEKGHFMFNEKRSILCRSRDSGPLTNLDKKDKKVTEKGYLVNSAGDVTNQNGEVIFKKNELSENGTIPLRFEKEKFNFNPFDIMGNFDNTTNVTKEIVEGIEFDLNGRSVNQHGYLIDLDGHIINRRGRRILHKYFLKADQNFPNLLNFSAKLFRLFSVMGTLKREPDTGDAIQQQDLDGQRFLDLRGRQVNRRGFLIDTSGNVINKKGDIVWDAKQLADGDFPKIPETMKFEIGQVQGQYEKEEDTRQPIIKEDPDLPIGCYKDDDGNIVNTLGYLIDQDLGHIIDKNGNMVFSRDELVDQGQNIPFVFRKIAVNGCDTPLSAIKNDQFETSEEEMEEGAMLEQSDSVARLKAQEDKILADVRKIEEQKLRDELEAARIQQEKEDKADLKRGPGAGIKMAEKREFNENDIMGDVERNRQGMPVNLIESSGGQFLDVKGRIISARGFLLDKKGHVLNRDGKLMFRRVQLTKDGDIPTPASIERFSFNPFKVTGNFQSMVMKPGDKSDNNKRPINSQGFLLNKKGHIVTLKGRVILDQCYLKDDGSFPELLNYQGQPFDILDVCGDLLRDKATGDAIQKKDTSSGKYWDKKGRQVSVRGYLIDRVGNVITAAGKKIFAKKELDANGEFPKLFKFTRFDENEISSKISLNEKGEVMVRSPRGEEAKSPVTKTADPVKGILQTRYGVDLSKGVVLDEDGKHVNKCGFLLDKKSNIIDVKGNKCFGKKLLTKDHMIPIVFRPVKNFDEERRYSVTIIPRLDKPQIIDEQIMDSLGNSEQDFQVKIEVSGGKNKMYATARGFTETNESSKIGSEVEYESKAQKSANSMSTKAGKMMSKTQTDWKRKSNHMKRLSLDLPEAIDQVNEEIQEVGEDIDSLIESIKSYRNSHQLDSKLRAAHADDSYQQIKEEFEDIVKTKHDKPPKGKSKQSKKTLKASPSPKRHAKASGKKKMTHAINEDSDFEGQDKEDGTNSMPNRKKKQSPRHGSIPTYSTKGKKSPKRSNSENSNDSSLSRKISSIPHKMTTAQNPNRLGEKLNSVSLKKNKHESDVAQQIGSTQFSAGSTKNPSHMNIQDPDLELKRFVSGGQELKQASTLDIHQEIIEVHTPNTYSPEKMKLKHDNMTSSKKNMMFQTAPPDRGFYNNGQQLKKGEQMSQLNSEVPQELDILDKHIQDFEAQQKKEAKNNKNRPNLQETLSRMTSDNFSDSNMKSSLEIRPNKPRLKRLETNYLAKLPRKQSNISNIEKARNLNSKTQAHTPKGSLPQVRIRKGANVVVKAEGFLSPKIANSTRNSKMSPNKFRMAGGAMFGFQTERKNIVPYRETWNQVHTDPGMIAESFKTRNELNDKLKQAFLNNNDIRKYKEIKRDEIIQRQAQMNETFKSRDKAWNTLMSHRDSQTSGRSLNNQSEALLKAISTKMKMPSKHNIHIHAEGNALRDQSGLSRQSRQSNDSRCNVNYSTNQQSFNFRDRSIRKEEQPEMFDKSAHREQSDLSDQDDQSPNANVDVSNFGGTGIELSDGTSSQQLPEEEMVERLSQESGSKISKGESQITTRSAKNAVHITPTEKRQ